VPAVAAERQVGTSIGGKYRLIRVLGRGGMGVVYEAEHAMTRRRVAIKVLHAHHKESGDAARRFINEAQAAGKISSPNVVEVLDGGEDGDGSLYLVMELLAGQDLSTQLLRYRRLEVAETVTIVAQVLQALIVAHHQGIIHRDIKPENIFLARSLTGETHVKILDFGISKAVEVDGNAPGLSVTQTNTTVGTPHYMSPEQARGERTLDRRADLWAVGVVMYECLAGRVPFDGDTYNDQIVRVITEPHTPLSHYDVPAGLSRIVDRALEKDRTRRYLDAAEMLADVRGFIERHREYASVPSHLLREPAPFEPSASTATARDVTMETSLDPALDRLLPGAGDTIRSVQMNAELPSLVDLSTDDAPTTIRMSPDEASANEHAPLAGGRASASLPRPVASPLAFSGPAGSSGHAVPSVINAERRDGANATQRRRTLVVVGGAVILAIGIGSLAAVLTTRARDGSRNTATTAMVTLHFVGIPPGAQLIVGGVPIYNSEVAVLPRSATAAPVQITSPGYRGVAFTVVPDRDQAVPVAMQPASDTPAPTTPALAPISPPVAPSFPPTRMTAPPAAPRAPSAPTPQPSATRNTASSPRTLAGAGFLTINAHPSCNVMIDSTRAGSTPIRRTSVSPGSHRVLCQSPTGAIRSRTITVRARQEVVVQFDR